MSRETSCLLSLSHDLVVALTVLIFLYNFLLIKYLHSPSKMSCAYFPILDRVLMGETWSQQTMERSSWEKAMAFPQEGSKQK
mmetsp:Transcript_4942/g.17901  ORF Transcript_4942/g.17901 Transcript_4942/m.17901 type:complete len:82 (+) Transcript_4942:779-1024(+)